MGKIKQGILGGFSGKVANVVGSSWKGIAVIKSLPLSVANPRTALQVNNRNGFSHVVFMAKILLVAVLKPLLDRFAVRMSGFNLFFQRNREYFDETGIIDYPSLNIAEGNVTGFESLVVLDQPGGSDYTITFDDNTGEGDALITDEVYGFVINATKDEISPITTNVARNAGSVTAPQTVTSEPADVIHAYVAFRRADGTKTSNTDYATVTFS